MHVCPEIIKNIVQNSRLFATLVLKNSFVLNRYFSDEVTFIKLHATVDFLFHAAEIMEIKLPFCPSWQSKIIQYEERVRTKRKRFAIFNDVDKNFNIKRSKNENHPKLASKL